MISALALTQGEDVRGGVLQERVWSFGYLWGGRGRVHGFGCVL
jgi:hypothetical protein